MEIVKEIEVDFIKKWCAEEKTLESGLISFSMKKINGINLSGDQFDERIELAGVYCEGVQYYDLKNLKFINNTGLANLIELLKSLLKQGTSLRLVNVNEGIQKKIDAMGLDNVLICN